MRLAVINADNLVTNVIVADADFTVPDHTLVESDAASPGDTWDGAAFTTPEPPEPSVSPKDRALAALESASSVAAIKAVLRDYLTS